MKRVNRLNKLTMLVLAALPVLAVAQSELGSINITGSGDALGAGLIQAEETPKARSSVQKSELDKQRATSNPFQDLDVLPGVFTSHTDATGLFGGVMNVRGFNSDQLGVTIDGVPVNDSGNFAVYPQEYTDIEDLCSVFLTQGSTDTDAPHVGATGGNVGLVSCDPLGEKRFRVSQTLGGNNLSRTYVRLDTQKSNGNSFFISASNTTADKWKGPGKADRQHVDSMWLYEGDQGTKASLGLIYNKAVNNNYYTPTLAEINSGNRLKEYSATYTPNVSQSPQYYGLSINPFENYIVKGNLTFKPSESSKISFDPYYWYGFGTGGSQQQLLNERTQKYINANGQRVTGGYDFNGNGVIDTYTVAESSLTQTHRPGFTLTYTNTIDQHALKAGLWYERADHQQSAPYVPVDANGNFNQFLQGYQYLQPNGQPLEYRDYKTISTANQLFAEDTIEISPKSTLVLGLRTPKITRDFTEKPNGSNALTAVYNTTATYSKVLPSISFSYKLSPEQTFFASLAKNFKAPPNYVLQPNTSTGALPASVRPEQSTNFDIGIRGNLQHLTYSATLFAIDFKDRLASQYDPISGFSQTTNVGGVKNKGLEFELGTKPVNGWSTYASLTLQDSKVEGNMLGSSASAVLATDGNAYPLTPKKMLGLVGQYAKGPFYAQLRGKYTDSVYTNLPNTEKAPSVTVFDFAAGYQLESTTFFKKPTVKFNVSNVFNRDYITPTGLQVNKGAYYYIGQPRTFSINLTSDF